MSLSFRASMPDFLFNRDTWVARDSSVTEDAGVKAPLFHSPISVNRQESDELLLVEVVECISKQPKRSLLKQISTSCALGLDDDEDEGDVALIESPVEKVVAIQGNHTASEPIANHQGDADAHDVLMGKPSNALHNGDEPSLDAHAENAKSLTAKNQTDAESLAALEKLVFTADNSSAGDHGNQAIAILNRVIAAYAKLDSQVAESNSAVKALENKLKAIESKRQQLGKQLREVSDRVHQTGVTSSELSSEPSFTLETLQAEIVESRADVQTRQCDGVLEYVKSIRKAMSVKASKAEEFIEPLRLSCDALQVNIQRVRLLERLEQLTEIQKSLVQKRGQVNQTIQHLVEQIS